MLFETPQTAETLPNVLQQLFGVGIHHVRAQVFLSENSLAESLCDTAERLLFGFRFEVLLSESDFFSGELSAKVGRKHRVRISGRFVALRHPQEPLAWVVVTRDSGEFERRVLSRMLGAVRPRATRPLLRSDQIEDVFRHLSAFEGVRDLRLSQVGSRTRIQSEGAARAVEADRRWTDLSVTEAFSDARESGQWVVDASGTYDWGKVSSADVKVSQRGIVSFRKVVAPVFWPVLDLVSEKGSERYLFLKNRERSPENQFHSRPFNIDFTHPVLASPDQLRRLKIVLSKIPHVTCTSLHGNPYFHAALVDYRDGSSYEIFVLSDSHLTVVPQGRSSVQALQRLCGKVFSDFREGSLSNVNA